MVAKNDITGDSIQTKGSSKEYQENLDRIFNHTEERIKKAKEKEEYFKKLALETKLRMEDNTGVTKNEYQDVLATEDCLDPKS